MKISIPGGETLEIDHIVSDYNGTIALDGRLIEGVAELIGKLAEEVTIHVITADTFGSVERELQGVPCIIHKIGPEEQDRAKAEYVASLGRNGVAALGNGRNDILMLRESVLGIGILHREGICTQTLMSTDIVCTSPLDALSYFREPKRLIATMRR